MHDNDGWDDCDTVYGHSEPGNPHELLGLTADEADTVKIIAAARVRLAKLRAGNGSETDVRRFLVRQIIAAREAMLRNAGCQQHPVACVTVGP